MNNNANSDGVFIGLIFIGMIGCLGFLHVIAWELDEIKKILKEKQ